MKHWYFLCVFCVNIVIPRNPFVLSHTTRQPAKKNLILKGIVIGTVPMACIHYNDADNLVCVGDKVGSDTVVEIRGEAVRVRRADGSTKTLLLADEKRVER